MEKTYKILKLLIWVLALAVVIVGASVLYNRLSADVELGGVATVDTEAVVAEDPTGETESARGSEAPDFTVYDLEGNAHNQSRQQRQHHVQHQTAGTEIATNMGRRSNGQFHFP